MSNSPRKYAGMKRTETATRPIRYPTTSCRKVKFAPYAKPGTLMNVTVLVSVATIDSMIAHQGTRWPLTK